jgi:tetratricopeptide (TPR) repeat protein
LLLGLFCEAGVSNELGDLKTAHAAAVEALAIATALKDEANSLLPAVHAQLGVVQTDLEDLSHAESNLKRALQLSQQIYGEDSLDTIEMNRTLGDFLLNTSRIAESLPILERGRDLAMKVAGAGESSIIPALAIVKRGRGLIEYGHLEAGLAQLRQVADMRRRQEPVPMLNVRVLEQIAAGLIETGYYSEAEALLAEASVMAMQLGWDKTPLQNDSVVLRTRLLLATGRADEAEKAFEAFRAGPAGTGSVYRRNLERQVQHAEIALAQGHMEAAAALAAAVRARAAASANRGYLARWEAHAALIEGKARRLAHRPADALSLLERAVELRTTLYDREYSPALADAQVALAECLLDVGQREQAARLAVRARRIQASHRELGEHYRNPLRALEARLGQSPPSF